MATVDSRLRDGIAAARAKRVDEARVLLQQAAEATPENATAWFWLAIVSQTSDTAISHLRRVLALEPSHATARDALVKVLTAQAERLRAQAERLLSEATSLANSPTMLRSNPALPDAPSEAVPTASPTADASCEPESPKAATVAAPKPDNEGDRTRTVLVIDDSPTIRKILSLTLENAGYSVVAEADGESGLLRLSDVTPDVVLLDIAMPGIDGYETCKRIRSDARTAHLPVLMLSGKDALFDKVKGHMSGATEYLTKPFETETVLAAVAGACASVA